MNNRIHFLPGHPELQRADEISGYYFSPLLSQISELMVSAWRTPTSEQIITHMSSPEPFDI